MSKRPRRTRPKSIPSDGTSTRLPRATPTTVAIKVGRPGGGFLDRQTGEQLGTLRERPAGHDRGDRHRGDVAGGLEARAAYELERQQASGGGCGQSRESWPFEQALAHGARIDRDDDERSESDSSAATPAASARLRKAAVSSLFPARRASAAR